MLIDILMWWIIGHFSAWLYLWARVFPIVFKGILAYALKTDNKKLYDEHNHIWHHIIATYIALVFIWPFALYLGIFYRDEFIKTYVKKFVGIDDDEE